MDQKILIVDDNILNIKVLARMLEKYELHIDSCNDGIECIDKLKNENDYEFILMDLMMPNLDGYETIKLIREKYKLDIPVIAVTADAVSGVKEKCLSLGFDDYITKPISREVLLNSIVNILTR